MRAGLLILAIVSTSCVRHSFYARHANHDYKLSDFSGVYVPHERLTKAQQQVFGNRITVNDFVPKGVAERLKANYQKQAATAPGLTVEIVRESDEATLAESTTRYYYLGVNRGPIDLVHYDFDDNRNAFERTQTKLVKNTLTHAKAVLVYDKNDKLKKTTDGGLSVEHQMRLFGRVLTVSHRITKLTEPWSKVFPPNQWEQEGAIKATFIRVEQPRYDARFRLRTATDHRR